jgi:type IV pilus assembly protein PilW
MRSTYFKPPSRGLSLIELMVAIALGLILVAVVIQIYVGSRATYNKQEDLSRLQENGRIALDVIGRSARIVGFKSNPSNALTGPLLPVSPLEIVGTEGAADVSDSLTIRFQGSGNGTGTADGSVVDCLGNAIDANQDPLVTTFNRFYIANNPAGRPSLFCDNRDDATENGVEIISEIEHLRFLYGVDTSGDFIADFYVPVSAITDWNLVVSVQIGLVAATSNTINPNLDTQTYSVLDKTYNPTDDRRSRRLYTQTIALRNRTP